MMIPGDLELSATVDGTVRQNVPIPPQQQQTTNSVLSGMISAAKSKQQGGATSSSSSSSSHGAVPPPPPSSSSSDPSSYAPSSPLPSCMRFDNSSHPTACLFHVLFKCLAIVLYLFGWNSMEDVMATVLCVLLLAADFWVVKNITGRLLVGLRWWNMVDPTTGETSWIFESAPPATTTTTTTTTAAIGGGYGSGAKPPTSPGATTTNAFDSRFFWSVLYLAPVAWFVLFLSAALTLNFQSLVALSGALVLSASNVYGYYMCSADQRRRWSEWMSAGANVGVMTSAMRNSRSLGWLFGRGGGGRPPAGGGGRQRVPQEDPNTMTGTFA